MGIVLGTGVLFVCTRYMWDTGGNFPQAVGPEARQQLFPPHASCGEYSSFFLAHVGATVVYFGAKELRIIA